MLPETAIDDETRTERRAKDSQAQAAMNDGQAKNTDQLIWRQVPGDFYSDAIYITAQGNISIDCGGTVYSLPVRKWHELAKIYFRYNDGETDRPKVR